MKTVLCFALFVAVALALSEQEYQTSFTNWMQTHQKSYHHEEFLSRYNIFKANSDFIEQSNAQNNGITLAMNQFGDLTREEFAAKMNGVKMPKDFETQGPVIMGIADPTLPSHYNWVSEGAVTGVKNQEQCGSCWSFSTTGSTEGCHKISGKSLVSLSEQNLMDCSWNYGNNGCGGGLMTDAMKYIIANKGIDTEASYPYTAQSSNQCKYNSANNAATLSSFTNVPSGDENTLLNYASKGPVSVAIDASQSSFQFYSNGVYYEPNCSSSQLDHGVLVVGWGVDDGKDYWIVKNSWGASWGQNGYIWMSRNRNNNCGIATMATLPHC